MDWVLLAFPSTAILTGILRRYALHRELLDIPNARSSHGVTTPRGGGLAIVLSVLFCWTGLVVSSTDPSNHEPWILVAGAGVALLGFVDDHGHLAARWRLLGHFGAAAWVMICLSPLPVVTLAGWTIESPLLLGSLSVLGLVWLLNLYNFMDGINGIASLQLIGVCSAVALLAWNDPALASLLPFTLILLASTLGFLFWNFPRARIFLGDCGSSFLGIMVGILMLQYASADAVWIDIFLILNAFFIGDASFTLARRCWHGESPAQAHRSHAYQLLARRFDSHTAVSLSVLAYLLIYLLPLAWGRKNGELMPALALLLAYLPVLLLALGVGAGKSAQDAPTKKNG